MQNKSVFWGLLIVIAIALGIYVVSATSPKSPVTTGNTPPSAVTFYCGGDNSFQATFATSTVALLFSDGTNLSLAQARSGSGIRYEATSTGADLLFASKGDWGSFTNSASTTDMRYTTCTAANVSAETGGRLIYENLGKSFTFTFPANMSVAGIEPGYGPNWTAPATTTGMVLAKVYLPKSFEPGTNFGDAWFTVGTSADAQSVADCTKNLSGAVATTTALIGDTTFTKLLFGGAGAGNRYDTTSYRFVKDNQCYAVEYTIHYSVFENYPKGMVKEFDEAKVTAALDEVARSFRFVQ